METSYSNGKPIDSFSATMIAEGEDEASLEDTIKAWSYLIGTGLCWKLQGFFGRQAQMFIDRGIISSKGEVDWNFIEEITY